MKPLSGTRVIDFTQAMAAPYCTMNLADMGADVIKLEPPGEGEPTRQLGAAHKRGHSATFMTMNRGKRGLAVDLKQPEGVEIVKRLTKTTDVFVQNYRPGVAERLGLGWDALSRVNPRLVYCAVSGFGGTGPYAPRGGYDLIAQGMSGIMSVTGDEDGAPAKSGVPVSDLSAGLFSAYGILCALEHRDRTGEGQLVDTSLLEAAMALTIWESAAYWVTGQAPRALGSAHRLSAPYQALRAADGYFPVGANNDRLFEGLCRALGRGDLASDPRYATNAARVVNRETLIETLQEVFMTKPYEEWEAILLGGGVPVGAINTIDRVVEHPQVVARGAFVNCEHPVAGKVRVVGPPARLSDTPADVRLPAPLLGEHTDRVLRARLGLDDREISRLRSVAAIG